MSPITGVRDSGGLNGLILSTHRQTEVGTRFESLPVPPDGWQSRVSRSFIGNPYHDGV